MVVFNPDHLSELIELESEGVDGLVDGLLEDYINGIPGYFENLSIAESEKNIKVIGNISHTLKSTCILVGLELASDIATTVELEAKDGIINSDNIHLLKSRIETGLVELKSFKNTRQSA